MTVDPYMQGVADERARIMALLADEATVEAVTETLIVRAEFNISGSRIVLSRVSDGKRDSLPQTLARATLAALRDLLGAS